MRTKAQRGEGAGGKIWAKETDGGIICKWHKFIHEQEGGHMPHKNEVAGRLWRSSSSSEAASCSRLEGIVSKIKSSKDCRSSGPGWLMCLFPYNLHVAVCVDASSVPLTSFLEPQYEPSHGMLRHKSQTSTNQPTTCSEDDPTDGFHLNVSPCKIFSARNPFLPTSVFLFRCSVSVIQLWQHLDDSCQDGSWSCFKMLEYIDVWRKKKPHQVLFGLIWLIGEYSSCRAADDSNAVTAIQTHNLSLSLIFFYFISLICVCRWRKKWQSEVMESAGGRTEEWRDQVWSRLNPLWLKSSILYRLKTTTASLFVASFTPRCLPSLSWQRVWNTILSGMIQTRSNLSRLLVFQFLFHFLCSPLCHSEGRALIHKLK